MDALDNTVVLQEQIWIFFLMHHKWEWKAEYTVSDSICFSIRQQQINRHEATMKADLEQLVTWNWGSGRPLRTYGRWLKQTLSMKVVGFSPKIATGRGEKCGMSPQMLEPYVSFDWLRESNTGFTWDYQWEGIISTASSLILRGSFTTALSRNSSTLSH